MSARQNKKQRKGRNNANNRERTVTTLTEDPNTPYLVPTPSEEPAGSVLMSSPFSVASSSAGNPGAISSVAYQLPGNYNTFGYNNTFGGPMHGPVHQPQQQPQSFYPSQQQQLILPSGQNDLEILEKLKEMIKNGQHELYRAVPQPAALANLYLGTTTTPQVPHHPEQAPDFHYGNTMDGPAQSKQTTGSGPSSPMDLGRRPPRIQSKDSWDPSGQRKPISSTTPSTQSTNNSNQTSPGYGSRYNQNNAPAAINTSNIPSVKTSSTGPPSAGVKSVDMQTSDVPSALTVSTTDLGPASPSLRSARFDSTTTNNRPTSSNIDHPDQARHSNDRPGHGESTYSGPRGPGNISPSKSSIFDGKDDVMRSRESGWPPRDSAPLPDDRHRDSDRPLPSPTSRSVTNGNGMSDARSNASDRFPPPSRDDRYYDRDRERDRDREYRDRRDWDRDRRIYDRFRDSRMSDIRRPPPEQRHYEPDYDRPFIARRYDPKSPDEPAVDNRRLPDTRAPPPHTPGDDRSVVGSSIPVNDHLSSARASSNDTRLPTDNSRLPESRAPLPESRVPAPENTPVRGPPFDNRHLKASEDDHRGGPTSTGERPSAPRSADVPGPGRPNDRDGVRTTPLPLAEDRSSRPQIPLEERINRPSLQDRLSQPPAIRPETVHLTRQASLEERISHIPVAEDSRDHPSRPSGIVPDRDRPGNTRSSLDERAGRPPPTQEERLRVDEHPGRYAPPVASTLGDRAAAYPPPRSASVIRDDPRSVKGPLSPPLRSLSRDYRRPVSRERSDIRGSNNYRPDERNYVDDRRPDPMDIDAPSRYNDSRVGPYRPFSPPSAADLARDRARMQIPPSPHMPSVDGPPYDDVDRRYPGRDWHYQQYNNDRRRDWSTAEEDSYYKSRAQWDRNAAPPPPSSDRDRFERDVPLRNHGWETRDERERRDNFPRAPSPRSFEPSRPLNSRLTDNFSSSVPSNDRSYAPPTPRDGPPLFSRVRQRSISPPRRPGPGDDIRPPMKRPRDDAYSADLYQGRGDPGPLRRPGDYPPHPPRSGSPPPSSSGSGYFDRSGPPPSSAGTTGTGGPNADREYPPGRDYPVPGYDRLRSPGPPRGYSRGGYGGRVDGRDDRRYLPPPPPSMLPPARRP